MKFSFFGRSLNVVFFVVFLIAVSVFMFWFAVNADKNDSVDPLRSGLNVETIDSTVRNEFLWKARLYDKNPDIVRREIVESASEVLTLAYDIDNKINMEERVNQIRRGSYVAINKRLIDKIYFADGFASGDGKLKNLTLETIISYANTVAEVNRSVDGVFDGVFAPKIGLFDSDTVYFDPKTGTAGLRLALFSTPDVPITLQFVFVDGEWKINPYPLIAETSIAIKNASVIQGGETDSNNSGVEGGNTDSESGQ